MAKNKYTTLWVHEDFKRTRDIISAKCGLPRRKATEGISEYLRNNEDAVDNFMKKFKESEKERRMVNRKTKKYKEPLFTPPRF
jgi:hypothetical protein